MQGDAYASDGAHGVSVYLSNACRALKNMSEVRETVTITAQPSAIPHGVDKPSLRSDEISQVCIVEVQRSPTIPTLLITALALQLETQHYQAVEQLRKKGSGAEDVPLSVLFTLSADSKALYHMLGLSGRSREQVLLLVLV